MRTYTELVLFGSLKKKMADVDDDSIRFELEDPTPLLDVVQIHKIPVNMVQLAMVNHSAVPKKSSIHPVIGWRCFLKNMLFLPIGTT